MIDLSAWPDAPLVIDAVQALLDKSLLRQWSAAGAVRQDIAEPYFGMYFSIHEYAVARLDAAGPTATLSAQQRHGRHYALRGSDEALEALARHGGVARIQSLVVELDNLVAACRELRRVLGPFPEGPLRLRLRLGGIAVAELTVTVRAGAFEPLRLPR